MDVMIRKLPSNIINYLNILNFLLFKIILATEKDVLFKKNPG